MKLSVPGLPATNPVHGSRAAAQTLFAVALLSAAVLLGGCKTAEEQAAEARVAAAQANLEWPGISYSTVQLKPDTSIAVLPFTVADDVENTRNFEKTFFAADLVQKLRESPVARNAVFSPADTPAVDYVVRGSATPSADSIWTTIRIEDIAGRLIWQGDYADAEWPVIANRIVEQIAADTNLSTAIDLKRVAAYSDGAISAPTDKSVAIANLAAGIERSKLLSRYTGLVIQNAHDYRQVYDDLRDQQQELARQAEAESQSQTASMLSGLAAGLGGIGAAAGGNQAGVAQAQMQMAQSEVDVAASQKRQSDIEAASQKLSESFGNVVASTSVVFLDKVYDFSGSYDDQLTEFRRVVKQSLINSAPTAGDPNPAPAGATPAN